VLKICLGAFAVVFLYCIVYLKLDGISKQAFEMKKVVNTK